MNKQCSHNQEDLVLHFYGELALERIPEIEGLLAVCDSCRNHYADLGNLQQEIPRVPSVALDDATMDAIRAATRSKLEAEVRQPRAIQLMPRITPRLQWGLVAAVVVVSFFTGRSTFFSGESALLADLESTTSVSAIDFNSNTGLVQIKFDDATPSQVEGSFEDAGIQSLLGYALTNLSDPASRLRTTRSVSEWAPVSSLPDESLVQALQHVLSTDTNDGIRLHALKALRALFVTVPVPEALRNDLITVLLQDKNSAMRLEAMDLLMASEMIDQDMIPIMEAASRDTNPLIRFQADEMLIGMDDELGSATPLEEIR